MKNKFTPGPWRSCKDSECSCRMIWSLPGDCPVFTAKDTGEHSLIGLAHHKWGDAPDIIYGEISKEQQQANAKLIASAPTMLNALQEARTALICNTLIDKSNMSKNALSVVESAINEAIK